MADSRAARIALVALCALGPAVFLVKGIVRPGGDVFPKPAAIPAVPVLLITIGGVSPADVTGPRTAPPMPHLSAFLRDATTFTAPQLGAAPGAPAVATALFGSFAKDHGVATASARAEAAVPALASELKKLGFATAHFSNSNLASEHALTAGFDLVRELPGAKGSEVAAELARFLGNEPPPRFFAWIDLADARGAAKTKNTLADADAGLGAVVEALASRRIGGDAITLLAADPNELSAIPTRAILAIQFPFEKYAGQVCPVALSTADLAPTALEVVRGAPPASWSGRSRKPDVQRFLSSGPSVAGPFPRAGGPPLWCAEESLRTLIATGDGAIVQFSDRSDPNNRIPPAGLVDAIKNASGGKP
jgi:hypothetical protein